LEELTILAERGKKRGRFRLGVGDLGESGPSSGQLEMIGDGNDARDRNTDFQQGETSV